MNFEFKVGDWVRFRPDSKRGQVDMELVTKFVAGIFHARTTGGAILRVRTSELVRVERPSDAVRAAEVAKRKEQKRIELAYRAKRVQGNREQFVDMVAIGIRLTAEGLPDKRCKPRYTAATSPFVIKTKPRGTL